MTTDPTDLPGFANAFPSTDAPPVATVATAAASFLAELNDFWRELKKNDLQVGEVLELVRAGATLAEAIALAVTAQRELSAVPKGQRISLVARVIAAQRHNSHP